MLISISFFINTGCGKVQKPNIIIFLADDLGYGDPACYGNPIIKTPHIDKLASQGVMLTDCHSGGTVCSPSRSALLTGRNPYRSGFFYIAGGGRHLHRDEITIAEVLKTRGYETSFFGKWHLSTLEKDRRNEPGPGDQGFDYWLGTSVNAFDGPENPAKFIRNGKPLGQLKGWYCDIIVEEACKWLSEIRDPEKPFFLYIASHEPHTPIQPPEKYRGLYTGDNTDELEKEINYGSIPRPERDISANKKEYYGTVHQLDDAFGHLMETVDRLELYDNTLVVFTSDNGPETPVTFVESLGQWDDPIRDKCFGTPGKFRGMKRYPYEGGHRVPGIIRWPGIIPPGTMSDKLFNGTDFFPVFCELVGASLPDDRPIDGINAFDAFLGREVPRDVPVIWYYPHYGDTYFRMPQMAMRKESFTLVGWLPEKPDSVQLMDWMKSSDPVRFELYDMVSDPYQHNDISVRHPDIVNDLRIVMTDLWIEMRDEGLRRLNE
ncbi:MAG: N-acetylgalactosamine 6-sulfate sulfatase [Bacteroides sp. SM23_62]|nr:MAG: N-acetylgalactosamine 6-sulfate sulfatase [Bacteroides sp. SM23_62]